MAESLLPTFFGTPAGSLKPSNEELLKRAWARLEEMDKLLLLMAQRCIVLRKAIQEVKDKLQANQNRSITRIASRTWSSDLFVPSHTLRAAFTSREMFESALTTVSFAFVDHHEYFDFDVLGLCFCPSDQILDDLEYHTWGLISAGHDHIVRNGVRLAPQSWYRSESVHLFELFREHGCPQRRKFYGDFKVYGREKSLNRRILGWTPRMGQHQDSLLLMEKSRAQSREGTKQTIASHVINAALPILHIHFTVGELARLDRSKMVSNQFCAIQLALIVAEYVLNGLRHRTWKRMDLLLLGIAWQDMAIYTTSKGSPVWSLVFSIIIAAVGVAPISLPGPAVTSSPPLSGLSKPDLLRHGSSEPGPSMRHFGSSEPGPSMRHFHIFSVSLLLAHLLYDYPVLSSWLLRCSPWMGSYSYLWILIVLFLLHGGVQHWYQTQQQDQPFLQHVRTFVSRLHTSAPKMLRCDVMWPLVAVVFHLLLFFATNYLTSCLGFRNLLLRLPRSTPRLWDGGIFGGFVYWILAATHLIWQGEKTKADKPGGRYYFALSLAIAFAQTITALTTIAGVMYMLSASSPERVYTETLREDLHHVQAFLLLDRSRNTLAQLANIRRMHRVKAGVNRHLDSMEDLVEEFGSLPLCLRDEYLVRAIDNALDNSLALHLRVKAWNFEEGEVVAGDVVKGAEDYLKKCVEVVDDIREAIMNRLMSRLVSREKMVRRPETRKCTSTRTRNTRMSEQGQGQRLGNCFGSMWMQSRSSNANPAIKSHQPFVMVWLFH
ncbi:hypothetical protein M436DRAFT_60248 [Aureobasidium namibiae CBS 147.97]|uniref:Uncharacterized protein n=1 Tax=Aureobasidium namibiae CBS 147.97 TaxID=1043004 RepID=A0A074WY12_9PEZI|nr:uncharacterized protein M436DRAFT_60248 [Aureobasidium namibiae CBS 147.97]KEQ76414.1 hypothetical protein M436DRAFT_60248 [Aureobasidium namibiae CBS 147.97]